MPRTRTALAAGAVAVAALAGALAAPAAAGASTSTGLKIVALAGNGQRLLSLDTANPGTSQRGIGVITGLTTDVRLVGLDYRPADGKLYGLGNAGGVYTVDDTNAVATRTANPALPLDGSASYGVDVNPAADALRVITSKGANLRLPLAVAGSAAVVDTALTRSVVPATTPATSEPALGLTGAAYTNNDLDASTGTTLFDIDTQRDQVTIQAPANSGTTSPTGNLGVDVGLVTGFDIYAAPTATGRAGALHAIALSKDTLYTIDLLSGAATGAVMVRDKSISEFAIRLVQS